MFKKASLSPINFSRTSGCLFIAASDDRGAITRTSAAVSLSFLLKANTPVIALCPEGFLVHKMCNHATLFDYLISVHMNVHLAVKELMIGFQALVKHSHWAQKGSLRT